MQNFSQTRERQCMKPTLHKTAALVLAMVLAGCSTTPRVAIDPQSISDQSQYKQDMDDCTSVATQYDLSSDTAGSAVAGAAAGGVAVAGVATAVAGAVFAPAIPFIIAGTLAGGGAAGGYSKAKETKAREQILADCMTDRGYRAYASR